MPALGPNFATWEMIFFSPAFMLPLLEIPSAKGEKGRFIESPE